MDRHFILSTPLRQLTLICQFIFGEVKLIWQNVLNNGCFRNGKMRDECWDKNFFSSNFQMLLSAILLKGLFIQPLLFLLPNTWITLILRLCALPQQHHHHHRHDHCRHRHDHYMYNYHNLLPLLQDSVPFIKMSNILFVNLHYCINSSSASGTHHDTTHTHTHTHTKFTAYGDISFSLTPKR